MSSPFSFTSGDVPQAQSEPDVAAVASATTAASSNLAKDDQQQHADQTVQSRALDSNHQASSTHSHTNSTDYNIADASSSCSCESLPVRRVRLRVMGPRHSRRRVRHRAWQTIGTDSATSTSPYSVNYDMACLFPHEWADWRKILIAYVAVPFATGVLTQVGAWMGGRVWQWMNVHQRQHDQHHATTHMQRGGDTQVNADSLMVAATRCRWICQKTHVNERRFTSEDETPKLLTCSGCC